MPVSGIDAWEGGEREQAGHFCELRQPCVGGLRFDRTRVCRLFNEVKTDLMFTSTPVCVDLHDWIGECETAGDRG